MTYAEFFSLTQEYIAMIKFEHKFIALSTFIINLHLTDKAKVRLFAKGDKL